MPEKDITNIDLAQTDSFVYNGQKLLMLLENGATEIIMRSPGNSMNPLIQYGELFAITPLHAGEEVLVGDVVVVKMKLSPKSRRESVACHLVTAVTKDPSGATMFQISNNQGFINGYTTNAYGKVRGVYSPNGNFISLDQRKKQVRLQ